MEAQHNTSDSLILRIAEDAQATAQSIAEKAQQSLTALMQENAERIDALRRDAEKRRAADVKSVLDGSRTRAELDGRKSALAGKRALMDAVYADAYAELCALSGDRRTALIRALIVREARDGDAVVPATKDRAAIKEMLEKLPVRVSLSEKDAPVTDGFVLLGQGYEKDCSFKAVLADTWTDAETETATLLFS